MIRSIFVFLFLYGMRLISRTFYRYQQQWLAPAPDRPWHVPYRVVAILNHTSLYEFLYAGMTDPAFLWRMARHCTIPIADVTLKRPLVGLFWRFVAGNIVAVSRERDATWEKVMASISDPDAMVIILPEGRMKRANGLDKFGRPLLVRGGIADLIRTTADGKFLVAYSQGLHHIQVPGEHFPRLFKPVRLRFECLDIREYRDRLSAGLAEDDVMAFRKRVIADLTDRRDRYCTSDRGGEDQPGAWPERGEYSTIEAQDVVPRVAAGA
jgi:hypothetical protein